MTSAQRITMVTLATSDMTVARAYYRALGWVEEASPSPDITFFRLSGQYFALYACAALEADLGQPVTLPAPGAVTLATNYPTEAEVDAAVADALAAGAREVTAAEPTEWGGYSAIVAAPDGHLWEFAMNPFWPLDDAGLVADAPVE